MRTRDVNAKSVGMCSVHEHDDKNIKRMNRKLRDMVLALDSDAAAAAAAASAAAAENTRKMHVKTKIKTRMWYPASYAQYKSMQTHFSKAQWFERLNDI